MKEQMELKIKKIMNHHETLHCDFSFDAPVEISTYTEIEFTLSNKGKYAELNLKVSNEELTMYNSVPDYEATAWDYLREILKGLD